MEDDDLKESVKALEGFKDNLINFAEEFSTKLSDDQKEEVKKHLSEIDLNDLVSMDKDLISSSGLNDIVSKFFG